MGTNPSREIPGLLLLLDRLGGSLRSRTDEWRLPLDQFWSSVFMAVPLFRTASVGMLIPLLVGAISWDCHAGGEGSEKDQVVVKVFELERAKWKIWESEREWRKRRCWCAGRATSRTACPTGTHLSFFIYLSTRRPEDKKSHCIARRGRGDAEDIPSSILEILRDNYFVEGGWEWTLNVEHCSCFHLKHKQTIGIWLRIFPNSQSRCPRLLSRARLRFTSSDIKGRFSKSRNQFLWRIDDSTTHVSWGKQCRSTGPKNRTNMSW